MKNIFSKTTENRTQNGVKSYSFPTRLLSPILIFTFLTLGVGQMWAYEFKNPKIYFNNADLKWENAMLLVGHGSWSCGYDQTTNPISNTKLVYFAPSADWGDQDGFTVCKASGWDCRGDAFTTRAGYATHIGLQYSYNFGSGNTYYVTGTIGNSPTIRVDYISGGYGAIPKYNATQGAKWRDTGTSYSITTGTWPATLNLQGTYLSGDGKSARSTIKSTASTDEDAKKVYGAVVTGEITHSFESLNSSYYFEGWGTGSTPSSTENTYSYNISENTTTYAFFSKTYTLTYDRKGTVGNSTLSVDVSNFSGTKESGSAIPTGHQITFTATPASGYVIEGWYSDAECTKSLDNGQNTKYTISSLDADKSVYVKFEQLKTITIKFAHETTAGWTIQGVRRYPESGGQSISANGTWVTIEFTNVYAVSNIDLAYSGGDWDYLNTATKITGDCCYNKDGSLNASCCVSAPNLTWTTAPADGKVGNYMKAVVNTTPVSGGSPRVTWSTSNSNIAAVNESTGEISYEAAGRATITAHVTWIATGDYCAGSDELSQEISVTSGAMVSVERTCPEYVSSHPGQVKLDISSTGASTGWYYRVCNSAKTAYYAPDEQSAASNTLSWTMAGALPPGSNTLVVELYNSDRHLVCTSNPVTVNVEIAELVTISAGANGSVHPSGTVYANSNNLHPTITATPDKYYHFDKWTSNNPEKASVADDKSATTTVTATASGYTITANFAGDQYRITYKDQGNVNYSGNNEGSLPATHTYGTATDLVNGTKEGFTFDGWYTDAECTGEAVTSIGATAKTSNFTLYAKWTEKMSALSTSNHYNVGNPGYAAPTVSNSATNVGYETTRTITATAVGTGYRFVGWTLTNCTRTDGGEATANQITIRSNGDGAAASVVANYEEDLSTEWKIIGQSPSDKANSPFSSWTYASSTNTMAKATGHSTESVAYATISVPATSVTGEYYEFKISNGTTHYGYGESAGYYILFDKTKTDQSVYSNNNNDHALRFKPNVAGDYTFKIDYSNNPKTVSVTFPTAYRVTYGVGTGYTSPGRVSTSPNITSGDYVIAGTNITFTATPNLGYKFVGWYNDAECTGAAVSTDASYTIASLSANTTLYAKFDYRPLYIHADFAPNGWDTPVQMTQSTENRAVYTYEIDPLAAKSGTPASEGHHFHFVNTVENPNDHKAYNYKGVQTPTGSGFLTKENIHLTHEDNATIQFDLTRKSKITITLTLQSIDDNPKPTVDIKADPYYDITYTAPSHGTYTIQVGAAAAVSANTEARANTTITLANTPDTGYHLDSWTVAKSEGNVEVSNNQFMMPAENVTVSATFKANTYSVQFNGNGATDGSMANQDFTYDAAQKLTANAFTKTGYTFAGWATEAAGAVAYTDGAEVSNLTTVNNGTATLYAKWTPNQYTVTLDKQTSAEGYGGNEGTVANQTVTFDATLTTVSGSMPTAKNGWAFMGFYSATGGNGRRFINPSGEWVANAGDTIRDSKWVYDGNVTLYAYYKKAQITNLIFDAAVVAPGTEVGVTPFVDPTPEGTNSICWKLLYNNGNLYTPQPNFANPREIANKVTFTAPNTSGMYLVAAVLRTGNECNGGTKLDSVTYPFQVAGDHTVTVQYKCGDVTLQGSTSVSARPLDWSENITAPTITGYTFTRWEAGDGITIKDGETNSNPTHIKAIYDGKLTAIYTKKNMIYFNNTLGWSDVWVYFYTSNGYWSNEYGTGAYKGKKFDAKSPFWDMHYGQMTQIEGTDIWYFDYTALGWDGWANVAFANMNKANAGEDNTSNDDLGFFSNTTENPIRVVRRGEYKTSLPMFVPLAGVEPVKLNNKKAEYYNEGYWMNYPENTGYSLHIYKGTTKEVQDEIRSIAFPFTADKTMPMEVTLELNANTTYGYEIHRADGAYYANNGTIKINASSDIKLSADQRGGIKTSAAGDYVFKLNFGNSKGYGYLFSVQYPVAVGSYRIVYTESGETLWSGHPKPAGWHHPSRSIEKKDGAKDIVSFYVKQGAASMKFQYASAVDGEGNVTWTDVAGAGGTIDLSSITQSGVYNFHLTQTNGSISVDKVEPYTGNYYIRTDNAGSTKWDNYRAADHQMTYSEFSKDRATNTFGELYTHYYMHWCPRGTNVKFCIANDYSSCITDTLVNDVVSLGNMADAGWLNRDNASEVYRDKFSANIRFMYDERTNKISRAYMSSSTNTDRKFLVLKSNTEFKNSDGTALSGSGESAVEGNYEAIFKDNEDWIYEREIKLTPGQKFKLYASYAQETAQENGSQHFCGNYANNDWENAENYVALVGGNGAPCNVRIIYDFKTNRLLAAMVPSGEINTEMDINADVMFIREHQGDIEQLIFNGKGKITDIKTAYAVMRFNKWTLNNREKTGDHIPLVSPASIYERAMYFISFPFEVKLSEVFGFGTYGQDWIIEYYDGAERARTGWWEGQPGFWRYVWDRKNFVLKPNVGYLLELELGNFKEGSGFWNNKNERLELFFPSSGNLGSITNASVTQTLPAHKCDINRAATEGLPDTPYPSTSYNRTVFDSHWNIMSVPTYVNVDDPNFVNTTWIGGEKGNVGPKFLYTWNMDDNTLTATSGKGFMYHAMHAYTVQYYGNVTWTTSVTPTAAPQRNTEYRGEYEFCLEVQQDDQMIDRTYVRLSDDENVTTGFEFSEDMTKQFNSRKANIFTIAGNTSLGGNSLPLSTTQTTVVPVGVKIKTAGDYTFSIPEGTDGIGVTLVDNETGVRTLLSALDYTVNLTAGTHDQRFVLEISPIQNTPTGIEDPTSDSSLKGRAQKRIIDGVLYIVKDGKIFDARGTRVE